MFRSVPTLVDSLRVCIYLLIYQKNTRFNWQSLPLCPCTKHDIFRGGLWKNHTEVDSGLEAGDNIGNDVHLVEALHLNRDVEQRE